MREWVEHTVGRILALKPRRVLEIGCGTGMLLLPRSRLTASTTTVWTSRPSAIRYVQTEAARLGLRQRDAAPGGCADELRGLRTGSFDLVILNSVIQYFPTADYLVEVLERALPSRERRRCDLPGRRAQLAAQRSISYLGGTERAPAFLSASELRRRVRHATRA